MTRRGTDSTVTYDPARYYDHAELTAVLTDLAERFPRLVELESIGTSFDGKEIWAVTVTNREIGRASEKPAVYVDGGIDPAEVVGCAAALHLVHRLATRHGTAAAATELLDEVAFHVLPCLNPYGVDAVMHTPVLLPGTRPSTDGGDDVLFGVDRCDIDGDGRILTMRVPDPDGDWRVSDRDPRLMVRRRPWEHGPAYRLLEEGRVTVDDPRQTTLFKGLEVPRERLYERVTNFDFPSEWPPAADGLVRSPMPFREPESRALAEFIVRHPNICLLVNQHSAGGLHLLAAVAGTAIPQMPSDDQRVHATIADIARETNGFPCEEHEYRGQPGLCSWARHALGIWTIVTELWDVGRAATGERTSPDAQGDDEREVELLRWNDRELDGRGFIDWHAHIHPQLGEVELGGWDWKWVMLNPPPRYLEEECRRQAEFIERLALLTPRIKVHRAGAERLGERLYAVRAEIRNRGWLPSDLSRWARSHDLVAPVRVAIEAVEPVIGSPTVAIGHLDGLAQGGGALPGNVREVEWVVRVGAEAECITITASSEKGGDHRLVVPLRAVWDDPGRARS